MRDALILLNELVSEHVLGEYAIGGAIGASFYVEATNTEDVDVFVVLTPSPGGIILLDAVWAAARAKGAVVDGEYLRVGDWPVQILPAKEGLVQEALVEAVDVEFDGVPTRVMTAEHLCAIAMETGRYKDYFRVSSFIEQKKVDIVLLKNLIIKYDLKDRISKVSNWPEEV